MYRSRLTQTPEEKTARFVSSISEDERIFQEDLDGTEAHDIMLCEQGIITRDDLKKILGALEKLRREKQLGKVTLDSHYEDVHELIESYVIRSVGLEVGGKLHTGRSRNDQVALDTRMSLRSELNDISLVLLSLLDTLLDRAEALKETKMMLYTHTQHAQIGAFSHYLLAFVDVLHRDLQRIQDCYGRVNLNPLGAGPIGGTSIAINRERTTVLLGFDGMVENSIDATSSRDFVLESASNLAILMAGLSRIVDDLILWSSTEFRFIEIDDRYASVSSIMPQKKNPTILELIRGKTGQVYGNLMNVFTIVKALPTGYSSDLQEMKPPLWESIDAVKTSLEILKDILATLNVDTKRVTDSWATSYAFAVDLAERLTEKEYLSFREAHMVVGTLVRELIASHTRPGDLTSKTVEHVIETVVGKKIQIDDELVKSVTNIDAILVDRKSSGGPSPREVDRMITERRRALEESKTRITARIQQLTQSKDKLREAVTRYL